MRQVGIRELKQTLSQTIRAVAAGEHVRVTLRGRPLADIVPVGSPSADPDLTELVTKGRLMPPSARRPSHHPPLVEGRRSASSLVREERDGEG